VSEPTKVTSRLRDYVLEERTDDWVRAVEGRPGTVAIVDENVWRLHRDGVLSGVRDPLILPIDEQHKTLATVSWLYDELLRRGLRRSGCVWSVGGGVTQDLTGFAVSTLYRGVGWVYVPTTLLAQADSCIGGKTSLNYGPYKNLIGTMYPPERIVLDSRFLDTLSSDDFFSGLGEVVKLHVLGGADTARRLADSMQAVLGRRTDELRAAVLASLRIKMPFIEEDEFDRGRRNLLNFGHCFGHALEAATSFAVPHGQAVVLGMLLAETVAVKRGIASAPFCHDLEQRLLLPALVQRIALDGAGQDSVIEAMRHDKKRTGAGLALVMCADEYRMVQVADLSEAEAYAALDELERW